MEALLTQHLETSPDVRGGKVCLAGTRFAVEDIVLPQHGLSQLDQVVLPGDGDRIHNDLALFNPAPLI